MFLPLLAGTLAAQTLVVDRPPAASPAPERIERAGGQFVSDFFRIGKEGEVWIIDTIRVWAIPAKGAACGKEIGDSIARITLLGALDNPPVPGQPVCDCHALIPLAAVPFARGSSAAGLRSVTVTPKNGAWQFDFHDVRWSAPGASDVLFTLRAEGRGVKACPAKARFSMAGSPAPADYRLHLLNEKGVPIGPADAESRPLTIGVQVWATRTHPKE